MIIRVYDFCGFPAVKGRICRPICCQLITFITIVAPLGTYALSCVDMWDLFTNTFVCELCGFPAEGSIKWNASFTVPIQTWVLGVH